MYRDRSWITRNAYSVASFVGTTHMHTFHSTSLVVVANFLITAADFIIAARW